MYICPSESEYVPTADDSRVSELTDAKVEFGLIPREDWFQPDWIDEVKATVARKDMEKNNVIYGGATVRFFPSDWTDVSANYS
jgi:Glycolipid 2-alpha-mannosyltransferase